MRLSHCHVNAYSAIPPIALFAQNRTMDDLEWIKAGLLKPGKTQRGIAKAIGIDTTGVNRMLKGNRAIKANELPKIRAYLEAPDGGMSKPQEEVTSVDNPQPSVASPNHGRVELASGTKSYLEQPRDLPILGSAKAGAEGFFLDQGEIQGMARRPPILQGIKNAFAVYVREDSMMPAYESGWVVHVHPTRPCKPGDNVVIEMLDGQAFIKRLVKRTEKHVVCKQWNPAGELKYDASKVKTIMLVVGSSIEE